MQFNVNTQDGQTTQAAKILNRNQYLVKTACNFSFSTGAIMGCQSLLVTAKSQMEFFRYLKMLEFLSVERCSRTRVDICRLVSPK